jgi:TonB family protein
MTPKPMLPDSDRASTSLDKDASGRVADMAAGEHHSDVAELAKTLAAHGGGAESFDLALDLVLNEVVEQARLATGATGAAIALSRSGEMVCRATAGADAPDLGVRVETRSGLSGACLQTGKIQQCGDTETDPRVNAEACRRLGVKSMLVLPLGYGKEPFGILEVFSSRPNAFSERDVNALQVLARRVVQNKIGSEEVTSVFLTPDGKSGGPPAELKIPSEEDLWRSEKAAIPVAPDDIPAAQELPRRTDLWASVLGVLVIVVAVLLGLLLGWHVAITRGLLGGSAGRARASAAAQASRPTVSAPAAQILSAGGSASSSQAGPAPAPKTTLVVNSARPRNGGLVVSQNGKVIYRLSSSETAAVGTSSATKGPTVTPGDKASDTRLIHRVEPTYPAEARAKHIQGSVALDVQVGEDGAVRNISVVAGDPVLSAAAVEAVKQWIYRPFSIDGHRAEMQTRITIKFVLPPA